MKRKQIRQVREQVPFKKTLSWLCMAGLLAGCAGEATASKANKPEYALEQCRRVTLYDGVTGARIVGAEDFAVDRRGERLFISAYNRRAVEKAARKKAAIIPQGGLYAAPIEKITGGDHLELTLQPVLAADEIAGGMRPHGLSYDQETGEIAFINRSYQRINRKWRMTPRIERIGAGGEAFMGRSELAPCAANDLDASGGETLMSFDHGACDWRAGLEDVFSLKRSGVAAEKGVVFDGASFANGLARTSDGALVLAATREKALLFMKETGDGLKPASRIALPGGPDNLTIASDGGIVAAVHPSLLKMGLYRKLGVGRAGSRIVKVDPDRKNVALLYDDRKGALFAAATVAIEWNNALIAGSVLDDGLLVCKKK